MKALHLYKQHGAVQFAYEDAPQPQPRHGEVLVRVSATGVTPAEPTWSETWKTRIGVERSMPIPGHEVAGMVEEMGTGVTTVTIGEDVYGLTDFSRDGAQAEYTIALPSELAPKPRSLDSTQAAAVPLTALTVWQALFDHAHLSTGQRILIHGAGGDVGSCAVLVARWTGAHVIGTASAETHGLLRRLGATDLIDSTSSRFEEVAREVDVVLDTMGGETLERSWGVLKKGGVLVSLVEKPSQERATAQGVRAVSFMVRPNRAQLVQIGNLIDAGQMCPVIQTVLPLSQARQAYEGTQHHGKVVLRVVDEDQLLRDIVEQERAARASYRELGVMGEMNQQQAYWETFASGEVSRELREMRHGELGPKAYEWLEEEREQTQQP
ncbi:MAG TPA: NADP-dependent oxidoreductase [Ktedonobacterales bacterium]|nr:NADP-dependent oxidoreductase [Ktedonobacterales bacterium]